MHFKSDVGSSPPPFNRVVTPASHLIYGRKSLNLRAYVIQFAVVKQSICGRKSLNLRA